MADNVRIERVNPREQPQELVSILNKLTAECFGKDVPIQETVERFADADELFLVENQGKIIGYGFNDILKLAGHKVNYFGSGFLHPGKQDNGLYHKLNMARTESIDADALMTRTQNPKVFSGFRRICEKTGHCLSPDVNGTIQALARDIAKAYTECTDELICPGAYGRELMANTPRPNSNIQSIFRQIDPKRGDAVVLIGLK